MSGFVVRPFAFIRHTHEALRAGFVGLTNAVAKNDLADLKRCFEALQAAMKVHALQEEQVLFPMLDQMFGDIASKAGLREVHEREDAHEHRLAHALDADDLGAAKASVVAWAVSFEEHLSHEEDVMVPLAQRMAPTIAGQAQKVREVMEADWQGLKETLLPYVVQTLADKPIETLRSFVAAVQISAADAYSDLEPVIRAALSADQLATLSEHGHLSE